MEKANFLHGKIENPANLPLFGTGYKHSVKDGKHPLADIKKALNSINSDTAFVIYGDYYFYIVEKK